MAVKKITSSAANKMIRKLEDEKRYLLAMEGIGNTYIVTDGKENETEKPDYDYSATCKRIEELDDIIRKIKHHLNVFNTTTVVEGYGKTVDELLVEMAQLNNRKMQLDTMRRRTSKERIMNVGSRNIIEYRVLNYDLEKVKEDYEKLSDKVIELQTALDVCNQTLFFEIDI